MKTSRNSASIYNACGRNAACRSTTMVGGIARESTCIDFSWLIIYHNDVAGKVIGQLSFKLLFFDICIR